MMTPLLLVAALSLGTAKNVAAPAGPGDDCLKCHGDLAVKKVVHPPVKNGMCLACHTPTSGAEHKFVEAKDGAQQCRQCHAWRNMEKVKHGPVDHGLCLFCHDPHQSDHHKRLRKPIFETCTQCHPSKRVQNNTVLTRHGALDPNRNPLVCVACHDPHTSPYPKRLKADPPMQVCFKCHKEAVEDYDGKKLLNVGEWVEGRPETWMRHGPVREGQCQMCHNPHGTDNLRMLKGAFPREFYESVENPGQPQDDFQLCFGCHDKRLMQDKMLTVPGVSNKDYSAEIQWTERPEGKRLVREGITGFRNKDENLHFRHVNRVDKGRTCRACHDFHASVNPKHIREGTKFGNWEFKLNYQKTETGGQCWPGCHVTRKYDRSIKMENPR
jgi:predicted CXXCH cytochrome family protein